MNNQTLSTNIEVEHNGNKYIVKKTQTYQPPTNLVLSEEYFFCGHKYITLEGLIGRIDEVSNGGSY